MANLIPVTPIDIRDRLAALLAGDAGITENFVNPIRRRDPGKAPSPAGETTLTPDGLNAGVTLCLAIPGLGLTDDTLSFGDLQVIQLALIVYVWTPTEFGPQEDAEAAEQSCADLCVLRTTQAVRTIRAYQVDPTPGDSLWHKSEFARQAGPASKMEVATTFHTPEGKYHVSITPINFYSQIARPLRRPTLA